MGWLTRCLFLLVLTCLLVDSLDKQGKRRTRRDTVRDEKRKWPGGIIPYIFAISTRFRTRAVFRAAVQEIEKNSCVRFIPRTSERDYVQVITGDGCYSIIGRDGGPQDLSLGIGCYRKGIAIHEIMHLLGFFHEHTRLDRDEHVTVNYANVMNESKRQFKQYKPSEGKTLDEPYDPDSIMHYSNKAFSKNGKNTILFKTNVTKQLGQRDKLSTIDVRQLNKLYRCVETNNQTEFDRKNRTLDVVAIDKCRDDPWSLYSGQCMFYSFMGSCYHSPKRMSYLCPRTCGYCRPTCVDTSEYCNFFSFYGYCLNDDVVRSRCKKTCKLCRVE